MKNPKHSDKPLDEEDLQLSIRVMLLRLVGLLNDVLPPGNNDLRRLLTLYLQELAKSMHDKIVTLAQSCRCSNTTDNREKLHSELPELSRILTDPDLNSALEQALADADRDCSLFALIHRSHLVQIKRAILLLERVTR